MLGKPNRIMEVKSMMTRSNLEDKMRGKIVLEWLILMKEPKQLNNTIMRWTIQETRCIKIRILQSRWAIMPKVNL